MVATADQLASSAGLSILRSGGNASDAAIAAAAVLSVTSPQACDLGGDLFALVHRPGEDVTALCAAGRAGSGADALQMRCENLEQIPPRGDIRAVTIPGCVDGWLLLHERYGSLPFERLLEPAVTYAAAGFPASPALAASSGEILHLPGAHDLNEPALANRGRLAPGTVIRRPSLANTLTAIASSGRQAFYLGPFGEGLHELGLGLFKRSDLARVQAEWVEPLHVRAWDHEIWAPPPPSQGYLTLAGAAVARGLPLPDDPDDPAWAHLLAEAARQVGWDRPQVLFDGADGAALLDDDRLAKQRAAVDPTKAGDRPVLSAAGDTTALSVVDRDRQAVSLVQSVAGRYGAHIIEPTTTVFLHNRGTGFSLEPGHPAELRPGRRPPHTLSPTLVTRPDGSLKATLGTMGGDAQPQILLQLLARLLASDAEAPSPDEVVRAKRWVLADGGFETWEANGPGHLTLESHTPEGWHPGLAERGHQVVRSETDPDHRFGHAQIITTEGEALHGAADPRSLGGAAAGYS